MTSVQAPKVAARPKSGDALVILLHALEQVAAAAVLILLAPLLAALALLIWAMSRRSPFVAHLRVGQDGRPLWVFKYRTMWGKPAAGGGVSLRETALVEHISERSCPAKSADDPRVTSRFAQFCRRHSVDELPQLIHVARGQMSLVGPRPITAIELREHYGVHAAEILAARPGLIGLWQLMGRNRLTYRQRLRLDLFLVRNCCARLYLRILMRAIPRVLSGRDAW
jgi:exopolysaccharide production protein ExoY